MCGWREKRGRDKGGIDIVKKRSAREKEMIDKFKFNREKRTFLGFWQHS